MTQLWGIDLGGTKIEGVVLDPSAAGRALHRLRLPTEADRGYDHVLAQIERVVAELERASGRRRPERIGFGTPGTTEPATGLLKNSNTVCLNGRPLASDLSIRLGLRASLANDANCLTLAEATLGAARGHGVVLGLILGTGVGGGMAVHGRVLAGRHGIAGEWGHNPLCGESAPCYCGRRGCIETVLSGPALERHYREAGGEDLRLPEIARRAASGEARAAATLERLRAKFGEALAAVINLLDPDAIVIGGGVGNLDLLYEGATRGAVLAHLFNPELHTPFLRPQLGDSAGVFGAALLSAQED
ncbi:MAG TPA: ROK family protein [Opitutaceae bacterium]|jgi:predicted NBD/HSP70 family sugar kinase|nr:ROK family protein [Opitutaceae bacterium]